MSEVELQTGIAIAAIRELHELALKQQARLDILEAKVEALERLPRPAVTVFRDPRTND